MFTLLPSDRRRCRHALDELPFIASDELADVLAALDEGDTLTGDQAGRLCDYLLDETGDGGMLTAELKREIGFHPSTARAIERQARLLAASLRDRDAR